MLVALTKMVMTAFTVSTGIDIDFPPSSLLEHDRSVVNAVLGMILANILKVLFRLYNLVVALVLQFVVGLPKEKVSLPPVGDRPVLKQSALEIADQIRRRERTSEEVVRTFIKRCNEVNEYLTALVDERFELAIEDARKVDKLIQSGEYDETELKEKFPLLGVPFTIKDSFCVKGLKHTAGLLHRKDHTSTEDASVVKALKRAGAIPIGVTNVSELCMWWEAVNTVYGRSKNPYDTRHTTGGSSGGEGGLQGAAGSAFGVGSDIAGSIRMPAFFCGLFGHKPTSGLICNWGQVPEVHGRLDEFLTAGPIVRHACDLKPLMDILMGENVKRLHKVPDLKNIRIMYMTHDGGSPLASRVDPEIQNCIRKAVQHLERKFGVKPQKVNIAKLYHGVEIWAQAMAGAGATPFCEELASKQGKVNPFVEFLKFFFNASPHTFSAIVLGIVEKIAYIGTKMPRHQTMIEMGHNFAKEFQELMKDDAIFIYPTHPAPAPRHNEAWQRPGDFSYCAIFNVLGVPVTQVPMGLGSKGLPLGIQIVGGKYADNLTMKIAQELEVAFGGWVPPS